MIPAYTLPVYASPCRLPDTTQDSVPGRWLGFTRAAISGGLCPLSFQGATLPEPDMNLSTHPAPLPHRLSHSVPVCEELWISLSDVPEPTHRSAVVALESLVLPACPAHQSLAKVLAEWI